MARLRQGGLVQPTPASYNQGEETTHDAKVRMHSKAHHNFVRAVALDPRREGVIYAGSHAPGRAFVFRSLDAGRTWKDISGNLSRQGIGGLVVHPQTGDVLLGSAYGTWVHPPPYRSRASLYKSLPVAGRPGDR